MTPRLHPERLAQAVAERVVALVVDALDVDALVRRVDLNAVLDGIDVDRLLERVDLEALLARVDLPAIVAGAASGTAGQTRDVLRERAARADDVVERWAARLVGRR